LCTGIVNMRAAHHIHGDIRVGQNHGFLPTPFPRSISASI
jgi:hypothetical protein